jgi:hypothetical protein
MTQINSYTSTAARFTDITDKLFMIEGTGTWYQDICKMSKAADTEKKWVEEKYSTGTANSSQKLDGADLTGDTPPTRTQYSNYIETNAQTAEVTDGMAAIARQGGEAGYKDLKAKSIADALVELKANIERSLINGVRSAGDATHKAQMEGLVPMALRVGVTAYTADTGWGTSAEVTFREMLQNIRTAGGLRNPNNKFIALSSFVTKDAISAGFKGNATVVQNLAENGTVYTDVGIYSTQFGPVAFKGHDAMVDNKVIVLEKVFANIAVLQATEKKVLAMTGLAFKQSYTNYCTQAYEKPSLLGHMLAS